MTRALIAAAILFVIGALAVAHHAYPRPPENGGNPAYREWFQSLHGKNGVSCCDIADGRITDAREVNGEWQALVDNRWEWYQGPPRWITIPQEQILDRVDNPTGSAVLFLHQDYTNPSGIGTLLCFVRPVEA